MIRNTEAFYQKTKKYQDERRKIVLEYENQVKALERFKGSAGYQEDLQKLKEDHEAKLKQLRTESEGGLHVILGEMMDAIGRRSIEAPTADQLNLLTVLKMKNHVTDEDLERVARAVKDNPIALDVVKEIARDKGLMPYLSDLEVEMSSEAAKRIVDRMRSNVNDFLLHDTSYASRLAKEHHDRLYGDDGRQPVKAELFEDLEGCFDKFAGIHGTEFQLFSEIVDAPGEKS